MKAFWNNLFFGMKECVPDKEMVAIKAGNKIRDDLRRIEDAIKAHDGNKALALIDEFKDVY